MRARWLTLPPPLRTRTSGVAAATASGASVDALSTSVPIVRIAASTAEADPAANVIAPVPGDRESCLAYVAGGESSLPPSYDVDRGIDTFGPGYYKRLARTLTHLKAMVAAYRLDAPAVLILDANENPVTHPDFSFWSDASTDDALAKFVDTVSGQDPNWRHAQLSILALSDAFGTLVMDWDEDGRPPATAITPTRRARTDSELWSYGAYLVSKQGLASTLLKFADRSHSAASASSLQFDLSGASCVEADNCVLWEGVGGEGWLVATPPPFAPGRQAASDEDASDVEVPVSELVKENVYHVRRWWRSADALLADAKRGSLSVPSDEALDEMMRGAGVDPADARAAPKDSVSAPESIDRSNDLQGEQADVDMDVAGHKQQRKEHPLNYWLNPIDRTGPINELLDRWRRRMGAAIAEPDSAMGRFGMGAGNAATFGLLGALAGDKDAQNKLRRSAVANKIYGEESMPKGADKPKDGDGDGKVNDGTSKEKEAMSYEKAAKGRCWDGYEPVPGKKAYSDGSCQPVGGKKKKKKSEKAAASCSSHSKPKKKKSKKVEKAALEIATKVAAYRRIQEKQAREVRIKLASHVLRIHHLRQELETYDPYQLSKSAAIGAHKADRLKAAALVRQIELEKQAFLGSLVGAGIGGLGRAGAGMLAGGAKQAIKSGIKGVGQGAKAGFGVDKAIGRTAVNAVPAALKTGLRGVASAGNMGGRGIGGAARGMVQGAKGGGGMAGAARGAIGGGARGVARGVKADPLAGTALLGGGAMAAGAGLQNAMRQPMQQGQQMLAQGQQAMQQAPQQAMQAMQQFPQAAGNYLSNIGNSVLGRGMAG